MNQTLALSNIGNHSSAHWCQHWHPMVAEVSLFHVAEVPNNMYVCAIPEIQTQGYVQKSVLDNNINYSFNENFFEDRKNFVLKVITKSVTISF